MMDGRRHSVDLPISRTLVALRRVRSLRDPSTNSMSKFSTLKDNVKWETSSNNGISLRFVKGCTQGGSDHDDQHRKEQRDDFRLHCVLQDSNTKLNSGYVLNIGRSLTTNLVEGLNQVDINTKKPFTERCNSYLKDDGTKCTLPTTNPLEESDSYNGLILSSSPLERVYHSAFKGKSQCKNQLKSYGVINDLGSRVGSPCCSHDAISSHSISLFVDEEVDLVNPSNRGCGICYCWSKTPRLIESNPSSEVQYLPLLSGNMGNTAFYGQKCWKLINNGITPYSETPRSFSQKFRPKSFDELVGQELVVKSLLGAISKGRIMPFYLFHGPRGTGKTSASRVFAAALNCLSVEEHKPCGLCRECILFFSGRSRDVKQVDSLRINKPNRVRSLIKNAIISPVSSRFKIFIIDECQLLHGDTWATLLNSLENLSRRVIFVMVTPDLDKLPQIAVSHSESYCFQTINENDISNQLEKICVQEGINFDRAALEFIASKSNGSLRDAEIMLDQLSLLGKRITISLAYKLIGIVSDDELLGLLELALSSDTSNTVIMARELMRSKIDPLQLTSQLANLIMDILVDASQEGSSEARRKFCRRHTSEADLQKLSHALRVLSEAEKHLRVSKNQTTWVTVALLQLSSAELNSMDSNPSKLCLANFHKKEGDPHSVPSTREKKHPVTCMCNGNKSYNLVIPEEWNGKLESIWKRAIDACQSNSLKKFLRKQGKLSSLCVNQGMAISELEFYHPNHVSRAEKSWKQIASSLQLVLGCDVEIRINLTPCASVSKFAKVKPLFSLFSCSRRGQQKSHSSTEHGSDTEVSDYIFERPMTGDRPILTFSSNCGSGKPHNFNHGREMVRAFRNSEGNVLSMGTTLSHTSQTPECAVDSPKGGKSDHEYNVLSIYEPDNQPSCFSRALRLQKKSHLAHTSKMTYLDNQQDNRLALPIPGETSFYRPPCSSDLFVSYCSKEYTNCCTGDDRLREGSEVPCWRTPAFPLKKLTNKRGQSYLVERILPCAAGK